MHKLEKLILESYSEVINEMAKTDMEQQAGSRVTQWEDLSDKQRAGLVKRYGEPKFNGEHDFFSKDMTTYFKASSKDSTTGTIGHKVITLPSFGSLYKNFADIISDIKKLMGSDDIRKDEAAREFFEITRTNFRKLQRYLRTERPEQYNMLKMQRMMEGIEKALNRVDEVTDYNDPVLMRARVAKKRSDDMKKLDAYSKSPEGRASSRAYASSERKEEKAREIVRKLKLKRAQVMSDMENDPEIEPTGGPVADMYGDQLNKIDNAIEKAASVYSKNMSYDQAVGKVNEFVGKELEDRNEPLYDKLVPGQGDAETVEGEMLRAINRIAYRFYNDGDKYFEYYGTETAGPAHSFLVNANHPLRSAMRKILDEPSGDASYERMIKDALDMILDYIESRRGKYTKNTLGGIYDYEPEFEDEEEEDDYDNYDDYDDEEDDDYYQEGVIKEEATPEEEPDMDASKETILEDATDIILGKFPTLKKAITKLQTNQFKEFVTSIDWISPRPSSFRVNIKNGQSYILKWTGTGFEAQILGKRYYIDKVDDYQQALDKLARLYKEGPMSGSGDEEAADTDSGSGGGGGGDFPGTDAGGGGDDAGLDALSGDAEPADDTGGADLGGEPIDFEEPGEEPEA